MAALPDYRLLKKTEERKKTAFPFESSTFNTFLEEILFPNPLVKI